MSKQSKSNGAKPRGNSASPIRKIGKNEIDHKRQWPSEKHLASSHHNPVPQPGQKNRIHSVLVALPVLMLIIGLVVYFRGESAQINGEPILSELVAREGQFKSVSEVTGIGKSRYYLWYTDGDRARGIRISEQQRHLLSELTLGDELAVEAAPTVDGSNTFWAYRISHLGVELVGPNVP